MRIKKKKKKPYYSSFQDSQILPVLKLHEHFHSWESYGRVAISEN